MKYSILMPYHDRLEQLKQTVRTFAQQYRGRMDVEVILVMDAKSLGEHAAVQDVLCGLPFWHKTLIGGDYPNPAMHYNQAAKIAKGDYLILTSPEVMHAGNVLRELDRFFDHTKEAYVSMGCQGLDVDGNFFKWFQHSHFRPAAYHFCAALPRLVYECFGGFDEQYSTGVGYDDDDLVMTVRQHGIPVVQQDTPVTMHQHHEKQHSPQRRALNKLNKGRFERKWNEGDS